MPILDPKSVAAQIADMQRDLKNLEKAFYDLVDAIRTEEKSNPKETKKPAALRIKAHNEKRSVAKQNSTKLGDYNQNNLKIQRHR